MAKQQSGRKARSLKKTMPLFIMKRLSEGSFILIFTGALFVLLSLLSYHFSDPGWTHVSQTGNAIANSGGRVGAYLADGLFFLFGYFSYLLPLAFVYIAWAFLNDLCSVRSLEKHVLLMRSAGFLWMIIGGCGLLNF